MKQAIDILLTPFNNTSFDLLVGLSLYYNNNSPKEIYDIVIMVKVKLFVIRCLDTSVFCILCHI